ncbi:MAG TPA: hypothetical protein VFC10_08570 [Terriglobia bacterium]|jgi:hypothetical protein|nr:hypothetical protein [Terriglobia bacterium]
MFSLLTRGGLCEHDTVYRRLQLPVHTLRQRLAGQINLNIWRDTTTFDAFAAPGVPASNRHPQAVTF